MGKIDNMFETKEKLLEAIIDCLPYNDQMKELDFTSMADAVLLTWRGIKFKVNFTGDVYEIDEVGCGISSAAAILFRELLQREHVSDSLREAKNSKIAVKGEIAKLVKPGMGTNEIFKAAESAKT